MTAENPESGVTPYRYDDNGNLKSKWDARATMCFGAVDAGKDAGDRCSGSAGYDALNRPLVKTYAGGAGAMSTVTFGYGQDLREVGDANATFVKGRLTTVDNGSGKVVYRRIAATKER